MVWSKKRSSKIERVDFGRGERRYEKVDFHSFVEEIAEVDLADSGLGPVEEEVEAGVDFEALLEEARSQAYGEGFVAGRNAARQEQGEMLEALEENWRECLQQIAGLGEQMAQQLDELAFAMARQLAERLLGAELHINPEAILPLSKTLVRNAIGLGEVKLCVAPSLVAFLEERSQELALEHPDGGALTICGDPRLAPGSCRLISQRGQIDALLNERLELLANLVEMHLRQGEEVGEGA